MPLIDSANDADPLIRFDEEFKVGNVLSGNLQEDGSYIHGKRLDALVDSSQELYGMEWPGSQSEGSPALRNINEFIGIWTSDSTELPRAKPIGSTVFPSIFLGAVSLSNRDPDSFDDAQGHGEGLESWGSDPKGAHRRGPSAVNGSVPPEADQPSAEP